MRNLLLAVVLLLATTVARAQWSDGFDRPNGGIGGNWTPVAGTWTVSGSRGLHTSGGVNEQLRYNGVSTAYQASVTRVDCFVSDTSLQYAGVVVGLGSTDAVLVKLQAQSGTGQLSHLGIYSLASLGAWSGTTYLPGGTTTAAGFMTLPAEFPSARMTVWFPNADMIQVDLDTNFDGTPDLTYTRDGVSTIAAGFGTGAGVGAFGPGLFDNFSASSATSRSDNFNQPDGPLSANWNVLGGTWAVAGNQGTHTSGAVAETVQYVNASMRYQDSTTSLDCITVGTALQYTGPVIGLGGTDAILVKLQGQTATGQFSHIGIYHTATLGQWTGTTTLPGGGTSPAGFQALPAGFASARMTVTFPTADIIRIDLDTNLDGAPDYTYTRDGVSSIASALGTGFGIGGYGPAVFDNFNTRFNHRHDGFNRADGAIGGNWAPLSGSWAISSNRGTQSVVNHSQMQYGGASLPYAASVVTMDCFNVGTALEYSGVVAGLGGTDAVLVKLQGQTATGQFSHIGIYGLAALGPWTGTTTLPDGTTTAGGFLELPAGFPAAARMTVSFPSADVVRIELDTNFDGTPEYVYMRNGLTSISAGFGSGSGAAAYGPAVFDNWSLRQSGNWSELGSAGELPATANVISSGLGALGRISGVLSGGLADMYKVNLCDPANFSATTVGGATFDTQLFLFNASGTGITSNDDSAGGAQSTLTNTFTGSLTPGSYYLAVSGYNRDPVSAGGLIWNNTPFASERAPDGPGASGAITGWSGTGGDGPYTIQLTGACYAAGGCYANCDGSTTSPILNVLDFGCFLNRFAAGDAYANCDGSTTPPVLNVLDFGCFLNKFAAGCP